MRTSVVAGLRRTFDSLTNRNYRVFMSGQLVSLCGTWMQSVGQGWLVLELTGDGTALGVTIALQCLPILLFAPLGGVIADRVPKRGLLMLTQVLAMLQAAAMGLLVATDHIELWMVYVMAAVLGTITAVDNPTRQSFVLEIVGPAALANAVTLNSVMTNVARVVGPAAAGILIALVGIAICFLLNALTFVAVIVALASMRASELTPSPPAARARGQLRAGLNYVLASRDLRVPVLMMTIVATLSYEFEVVLPLLAERTFEGGAGTFALFTSAMGAGAVIGGLTIAGRDRRGADHVIGWAAAGLGVSMLATAMAPTTLLAVVVLVGSGGSAIVFFATVNTILQLRADPAMRGRVMAFWAMGLFGTKPIGGALIGWTSEHAGPRIGLVVGGLAALGAALLGWRSVRGARLDSIGGPSPGPYPAPASGLSFDPET